MRRADGGTVSTATVASVRAVAGAAAMWDLSVGQVHTFAVGDGRYVVHNANCKYTHAEAQLAKDRDAGVTAAWKDEQELVDTTGNGTRDWSDAEKQELLATGKVKGYEGHHIYSAREFPELAANPDNIEFLGPSRRPHLDAHAGLGGRPANFQNTTGRGSLGEDLIHRRTLIDMFNLGM